MKKVAITLLAFTCGTGSVLADTTEIVSLDEADRVVQALDARMSANGRTISFSNIPSSFDQIFARAAHPYTEALIAAVPKLHGQHGRLRTITGQPPAPTDRIAGCPFAARCDYADTRCFNELPPTANADGDGDHSASCWRVVDR